MPAEGVPITVWLFIGTISLLWTVGAFLPFERPTRIVCSVAAMVWWWVWAIHATSLDLWSHGELTQYGFAEFLYLGGVTGAIMLVVAAWHAFMAVNPADDESTNPADEFQHDTGGR